MTRALNRAAADTAEHKRLGVGGFLRALGATWRRSQRRIWVVAAVLLAAEIAISFATYLHDLRPQGLRFGAAIKPVHAAVTIWAMIASYRAILTEDPGIWRVDGSTLRFTGGAAIEFGLAIATVMLAQLWMSAMLGALDVGEPAAGTVRIAGITLVAVLVTIGFLRVQPWLAGLAIGRRDFSLQRSWTGTAGMNRPIIASWALTLLPLMMVYAAIEMVAARSAPAGLGHLPIAIAAALVVTAIAIVSALLNAAIFRLISGPAAPLADGR